MNIVTPVSPSCLSIDYGASGGAPIYALLKRSAKSKALSVDEIERDKRKAIAYKNRSRAYYFEGNRDLTLWLTS